MSKQYVLSNIHGYLQTFNQLIEDWHEEEETLIISGNVIDYGHNSFLVCKRLLELKEAFPETVIFLKGKHEILLNEFRKNPYDCYDNFIENGGLPTLLSFYQGGLTYEEMYNKYFLIEAILPEIDFSDLDRYLEQSQPNYETPHSIFPSELESLTSLSDYYGDDDFRTIFIKSDEDARFKLHHLNNQLEEKITIQFNSIREDTVFYQSRYALLGKEPSNWSEAYSWGHHIEYGIVTEIVQVPAEN
mgnify:CR=1 FL=1